MLKEGSFHRLEFPCGNRNPEPLLKKSLRCQIGSVNCIATNVPSRVVDLFIPISEKVATSILHSDLEEINIWAPHFVEKYSLWARNRKPRVFKSFVKKLFFGSNLTTLKLYEVTITECCWEMFARLSHCLPSLESFVFHTKYVMNRFREKILSPSLLYSFVMIPQRLKILQLRGCFSLRLLAGCLKQRVSNGFFTERMKCFMLNYPKGQLELRQLLAVVEKQAMIGELTVSQAPLSWLIPASLDKKAIDFLKTSTAVVLDSNSVTIDNTHLGFLP